MTRQEITKKLERIYGELEELQETDLFQENEDFMGESGEAMGHINNLIDSIEEEN